MENIVCDKNVYDKLKIVWRKCEVRDLEHEIFLSLKKTYGEDFTRWWNKNVEQERKFLFLELDLEIVGVTSFWWEDEKNKIIKIPTIKILEKYQGCKLINILSFELFSKILKKGKDINKIFFTINLEESDLKDLCEIMESYGFKVNQKEKYKVKGMDREDFFMEFMWNEEIKNKSIYNKRIPIVPKELKDFRGKILTIKPKYCKKLITNNLDEIKWSGSEKSIFSIEKYYFCHKLMSEKYKIGDYVFFHKTKDEKLDGNWSKPILIAVARIKQKLDSSQVSQLDYNKKSAFKSAFDLWNEENTNKKDWSKVLVLDFKFLLNKVIPYGEYVKVLRSSDERPEDWVFGIKKFHQILIESNNELNIV